MNAIIKDSRTNSRRIFSELAQGEFFMYDGHLLQKILSATLAHIPRYNRAIRASDGHMFIAITDATLVTPVQVTIEIT